MKGIYGLLVAVALGAAAAMLNWTYLIRRGSDFEKEEYVGIGRDVEFGERFGEQHLQPVPIPRNAEGSLPSFAVRWEDRGRVLGMYATRRLEKGELLIERSTAGDESVLITPRDKPRPLSEDEQAISVPVDTRTFVPSLHKPGDMISFVVPRDPSTPGAGSLGTGEGGNMQTIGPFEIHSIGNRYSSSDVAAAAQQRTLQENVLRVVIRKRNGELDAASAQLMQLLLNTQFRQVVVVTHPTGESRVEQIQGMVRSLSIDELQRLRDWIKGWQPSTASK